MLTAQEIEEWYGQDYLKLIDDAIQREVKARVTVPGEILSVQIFGLTLEFSGEGVCIGAQRSTETRERLW